MSYGIMEERIGALTQKEINCIDAGTENCPCYLAVTGDCLVCSRLQGKDYCNCNWKGVCIYNEFIQGNRKVNNPRREFEAPIVEKIFYREDLVVYILDVGKGFAMKAGRPGSYLFVKGSGASSFYDIPISVMKADIEKGQIHLAIKIISSKTKALLTENERLALRGPYRNGMHGISTILNKKGKNLKTLIVAKGIGVAPGILASRAFRNKGTLDMVVDTEKISKALIEDYVDSEREADDLRMTEPDTLRMTDTGGMLLYLSLTDQSTVKKLESMMENTRYDNVVLLVSDYYIADLGRMVKKILPAADLAVSNNFRICCGEGLCGSCSIDTSAGDTIKMCKCQMDGDDFLDLYSSSSV